MRTSKIFSYFCSALLSIFSLLWSEVDFVVDADDDDGKVADVVDDDDDDDDVAFDADRFEYDDDASGRLNLVE